MSNERFYSFVAVPVLNLAINYLIFDSESSNIWFQCIFSYKNFNKASGDALLENYVK